MENSGKQVSDFVSRKIGWILESKNDSAVGAILARLRRGIGKTPGSIPELWEMTLGDLPEALGGRSSAPTKGEWAVYTALTLFALHQQGNDRKGKPMHRGGESLGASIRHLVNDEDDKARVKRRFDAAATSRSPDEFANHLRGLVQLLKAEGIPLDYAALAEDLFWFQYPENRNNVRLRWGRDFSRYLRSSDDGQGNKDEVEEEKNENQ